jgi:archaellum component FlaC|tara:strand:+ start:15104 stop:15340 length:237 start_codon:yes stop_codon:yes gene_type:complete
MEQEEYISKDKNGNKNIAWNEEPFNLTLNELEEKIRQIQATVEMLHEETIFLKKELLEQKTRLEFYKHHQKRVLKSNV